MATQGQTPRAKVKEKLAGSSDDPIPAQCAVGLPTTAGQNPKGQCQGTFSSLLAGGSSLQKVFLFSANSYKYVQEGEGISEVSGH